ncbi:MAG: twin-arginine translocase TatA/TatE family subunit [Planctomycetota bacterium]
MHRTPFYPSGYGASGPPSLIAGAFCFRQFQSAFGLDPVCCPPVIALFGSLGWQEMMLLFIVGLLLYGRNLPEAGRSLGRIVAQLKRSFYSFKEQLDRDGELRDVKQAIQDTAREVKGVAKVPRAVMNPRGALTELTHEAMTSPLPSDDSADSQPSNTQRPNPEASHTESSQPESAQTESSQKSKP